MHDKPGYPSCLNSICAAIGGLIRDSSKEAEKALRRACEWVFSTQSENGTFVEPEDLASIPNLPPWIRPGKPTPNMPQIVSYLLHAGYQDRIETKRSMDHLIRYWRNPDGSFKRRYMVWSIIEILTRSGLPEDSRLVQEAIRLLFSGASTRLERHDLGKTMTWSRTFSSN